MQCLFVRVPAVLFHLIFAAIVFIKTFSVASEQISIYNGGGLRTFVIEDSLDDNGNSTLEIEEDSHRSFLEEISVSINKTLQDYDKNIRPNLYGPPVRVRVTLHVEGIPLISEIDMEYKIDLYLRQSWKDGRLRFNTSRPINYVPLPNEFGENLWKPDTYFPNEKDSILHAATVANGFYRWYPSTGRILHSLRLTLTLTCPMDLTKFPMDSQICSVAAGSFGLPDTDIVYEWDNSAPVIQFGPNSLKLLHNFNLVGHRLRRVKEQFITGKYSFFYCDFLLQRSISFYVIELYIPCALVVIISWCPFWMGRDAVPERMSIGVTGVLTITTLLLSAHASSPKISYVKAIDIYVGVCFCMVFASLLQSAFVGYFLKKGTTRNRIQRRASRRLMMFNRGHANGNGLGDAHGNKTDWSNMPARTLPDSSSAPAKSEQKLGSEARCCKIAIFDILARGFFPIIFLAFNAVYWYYYLKYRDAEESKQPTWIPIQDAII